MELRSFRSPEIRILVVDDQAAVRESICLFLKSQRRFTVVGEAKTLSGALAQVRLKHPDIILLDLMMGEESALDYIEQFKHVSSRSRILILTGDLDSRTRERAIQLGGKGIVLKTQISKLLFDAIDRVHRGEVWLDNEAVANAVSRLVQPQLEDSDVSTTGWDVPVRREQSRARSARTESPRLHRCVSG